MGKTRNTGKLATQIQFDNSNNLVIGNSTSSSFNTSGSVNATGGITGSIYGIGNPTSFSSSISSDLVNLESKSASVDTSISSINSFTASNGNTSLNAATSSYSKLTGGNTFTGTQIVSASVYIQGDLVVQGSSSIQYISASSVSIGTNIVQLNTATPAVRFGGLSVQDSGSSAGVTGSMLWDSCCNRWIYSNPSGVGYSGGVLMSGPRASTFGNEPTLTCNYIAKSGGGDHLYDSLVYDDGSRLYVGGITSQTQGGTTSIVIENPTLTNTRGIAFYSNDGTQNPRTWILHCTTSGTQQLQFDSDYSSATTRSSFVFLNGNVGIGTVSPSTNLEVYRCTTDRCVLTRTLILNNNSTSNPYSGFGTGILFKGTDYSNAVQCYGAVDTIMEYSNRSTPQPDTGFCAGLVFSTGTNGALTERMRISSGGNIGIGTISPNAPLHVCNSCTITNISIQNVNCAGYALYQAKSACTAYTWQMGSWNDGTYRIGQSGVGDYMTIATSGNVGIGTTTPQKLLEVRTGGTSTTPSMIFAGGISQAIIGGEAQIAISSNISPTTGTPTSTELARAGMGFQYLSAAQPSEFSIGIQCTNVCNSNVKIWNNATRLTISSTGISTFACQICAPTVYSSSDSYFCGSTYGIMGLGAKVHEGTYHVYTGASCVLSLPINYGSASSIYLFGSLLGNDSMHYAHMMYYYRNDFAGFTGSTITQMSCYNTSTAGQRYTFSIVDPGGIGKSACPIKINITCANGPDVGAGSYCTKFKIVVYNIPG